MNTDSGRLGGNPLTTTLSLTFAFCCSVDEDFLLALSAGVVDGDVDGDTEVVVVFDFPRPTTCKVPSCHNPFKSLTGPMKPEISIPTKYLVDLSSHADKAGDASTTLIAYVYNHSTEINDKTWHEMSLDRDITQRLQEKYDPAMADEAREWIETVSWRDSSRG